MENVTNVVVAAQQRYARDHSVFERHADVMINNARGPVAVRLDGRAFSTLTKRYVKPFDPRIDDAIAAGCDALMAAGLGVELAYSQSDEVTALIPSSRVPFAGRAEKIATVCAATVTAAVSLHLNEPAVFDGRVLTLTSDIEALGMLADRQRDAQRNCVSTVAYWTLVQQEGMTGRQATKTLRPLSRANRVHLLDQLGVDYRTQIAAEHKLGVLHREVVMPHEGYNPITGRHVQTTRRRRVRECAPLFHDLSVLPWALNV